MARGPLVLVDADPLVYRAAFGGQKTRVRASIVEGERVYERTFGSAVALREFSKENPDAEIVERDDLTELMPLPFVLASAKSTLERISYATCSGGLHLILSPEGGTSYRHLIAKQRGYKSNRSSRARPVYYPDIRKYLIDRHGARVVEQREADDELSILANDLRADGDTYVVATIDKDLDQIPGHHYDYREHVSYMVDQESAERWFWIQALAGDPTDAIPGCWKIGATKAARIVDEVLETACTQEDIWQALVSVYEDSKATAGCPYADQPAVDVATETARLVYLQKRAGELWMPPPAQPRIMQELRGRDEF